MQINRYELFGGKLFFRNKWFPVLLTVFLILVMSDQIIRMAQGATLFLFVSVVLEITLLVYLFRSNPLFLFVFNIWFILIGAQLIFAILMFSSSTKADPEEAWNMIFPIVLLVMVILLSVGKDKFAYVKDKGFERKNNGP